jgi:hypothetical protein
MGPIQVKDSVRSNSDCIEQDKFGVVVAITISKQTPKVKKVTYHVLWEDFKISLPHSRKSLSRDHTIRDLANAEIYKRVEETERARIECPDDVSLFKEVDTTSRDYKPTCRDYYHEKKERQRITEETDEQIAAAEEIELEKRLKDNLKVNTAEYKSPDITNVIFAKYPQQKHKIASDYSDGPCYIFLPYKIVT